DQVLGGDADGPAEPRRLADHLIEGVNGLRTADARNRLHLLAALEQFHREHMRAQFQQPLQIRAHFRPVIGHLKSPSRFPLLGALPLVELTAEFITRFDRRQPISAVEVMEIEMMAHWPDALRASLDVAREYRMSRRWLIGISFVIGEGYVPAQSPGPLPYQLLRLALRRVQAGDLHQIKRPHGLEPNVLRRNERQE